MTTELYGDQGRLARGASMDIDEVCRRFEAAWKTGTPPRIEDYLDASGEDATAQRQLLTELVLTDLDYRWHQAVAPSAETASAADGGTRGVDSASEDLRPCPQIEAYVARYPALGSLESLGVDVVVDEYHIRRRCGHRPEHDEYLRRFPHLRDELRAALQEVDRDLSRQRPASGPSANPSRDVSPQADAVTADELVDHVRQAGILDAAGLRRLEGVVTASGRPSDGAALTQHLVASGVITAFQAETLLGKAPNRLVFGNYILLEKLGQGGMGQVFKARHRRMERLVAVKFLTPAMAGNADAVERFRREVRAAAQLVHPQIVTAYDADESEGQVFLVMEYVDGRDLAVILREQGRLSAERAVSYVLQAARGLQYAHEQGVIHRDVKPANLLVTKQDTVKLLDLGLARVAVSGLEGRAEPLTYCGALLGTYDYLAPEQASAPREADQRVDIYALGCTLYRMLTGRAPYPAETLTESLLAHREAPLPSVSEHCPDVPAALDATCRKMMAKRPEDRYQSMTGVIAALESLTGPQDSAVAPANTRRKTRKIAVPAGVAGAVAVGMAALLWAGMVLFWQTKQGTVRIEINDPAIEVLVDGTGATIKGAEPQEIKAEPGPHGLRIKWGTLEFETDKFILSRGDTVKLKVELLPSGLQVVQGDTPLGARPLPAIAPFQTQQARAYQEAWARHLGVPVEYTNTAGMKFILIPPGEFTMGGTPAEMEEALKKVASDEPHWKECIKSEAPQHKVILTQAFYLGVHEVTQAQYEQVMGQNPSTFSARGAFKAAVVGLNTSPHPVETVNWSDAAEFCRKLSAKEEFKPFQFKPRAGKAVRTGAFQFCRGVLGCGALG